MAQYEKVAVPIVDDNGMVIASVQVTVKDPDSGNPITIYSNSVGGAEGNPITTGVDGLLEFYVKIETNQRIKLEAAKTDFDFTAFNAIYDRYTVACGLGIAWNNTTKTLDVDGATVFNNSEADKDFRVGASGVTKALFVEGANGIVTMEAQSCAGAYQSATAQVLPTGAARVVVLDGESFDQAGEIDTRTVVGVADATEANKLHDADGGFPADAASAGGIIWNTTDNTYTTVAAFVDSGELTLTDDIMADTNGYVLYFSRFTALEDGKYQISGAVTFAALADQVAVQVIIRVNGATKTFQELKSAEAGRLVVSVCRVIPLSTGDYVQLATQQDDAGDEAMTKGSIYTWMTITKVA